MTRRPRARAPRRHLDRHGRRAAGREDHHHVRRAEGEVREDDLGQAGCPLDEHRLALAVRADDLGVERHRQLDHRVEPRVRAVAREHLLDRDARVAGPEQVDEAVVRDRLGAPAAGGLDGLALGRRQALEQDASPRDSHSRAGWTAVGWAAISRRHPTRTRWPRPGPRPPCGRGSRRASSRSRSRPTRVTPRAITSSSASSVRTPPAALTPMCGEVLARMRMRSSWVAPLGANPVEVLTKSAAGGLAQVAGPDLLVVGQVGVLEDDLDERPGGVGDVDDRRDVGQDLGVATRLEGPDLDDHVELPRAVADRPHRLEHLGHGQVVAVREADRRPDRDVGARPGSPAPGRHRPAGRTPTRRRSRRRAGSRHRRTRRRARVEAASGRSSWRRRGS